MPFSQSFSTQLVGSWVKPHWLADHQKVYGKEGSWWRVGAEQLPDALDDAVRLAVADQNDAGITYATDGEQRRQTFSGHFYGLEGIDTETLGAFTNFDNDIVQYLEMRKKPGSTDAPAAKPTMPKVMFPRVVRDVKWPGPMVVDAARFLRQYAANRTKVTVIGPVTLSYRLVDEHYGDHGKLVMALAEALNQELRALADAGIDLIQIDEPEVHFRYSQCRPFAVEAINRALHGVNAKTACHVCYGYSKNIAVKHQTPVYPDAVKLVAQSNADAISVEYEQPGYTPDFLAALGNKDLILGVLSLDPYSRVESVAHIVSRVTHAAEVVEPQRISLAPDCGMWFLDRALAVGKLRSMTLAADVLRHQLASGS